MQPAWPGVDRGLHRRWEEVAGRPVSVVELGSGDPVVPIDERPGSRVDDTPAAA